MIRFANTVDIDREPEAVYAYLADLEHTSEWNPAITSSQKVTPGPIGIGTRYRQARSAPTPGVEMLEITGLEAPRRIEVIGKVGWFNARLSYELTSTSSGTRLTNTAELESPLPLTFVGNIFGSRIKASVAENLGVLKTLLEGSRGVAPSRVSDSDSADH